MKPVLIVGAGIGGISTALALAANGLDSLVLEARQEHSMVDRGDILQPSTLPLLQRWGVNEHICDSSRLTFHTFQMLDAAGGQLFVADTSRILPSPLPFTSIRHADLLTAARGAARATGKVTMHFGQRAVEILDEDGAVCGVRTASDEFRSPITVFATGGTSSLCDGIFGRPSIHHYRSAFHNLRVPQFSDNNDAASYVVGSDGTLVFVPLPNNEQRIGLQVPLSALGDVRSQSFVDDQIRRRFKPLVDVSLDPIDRPQTYILRRLSRPRWVRRGAVALGDAAHQVHPVGGQGMNLAIHDAAALADSLATTVTTSSADIFEAMLQFENMRRHTVRRTQFRTHFLGRIGDRPLSARHRAMLRAANQSVAAKRLIMRTVMEVQ